MLHLREDSHRIVKSANLNWRDKNCGIFRFAFVTRVFGWQKFTDLKLKAFVFQFLNKQQNQSNQKNFPSRSQTSELSAFD